MNESVVTSLPFVEKTSSKPDEAGDDGAVRVGVLPSIVGVASPCETHQ